MKTPRLITVAALLVGLVACGSSPSDGSEGGPSTSVTGGTVAGVGLLPNSTQASNTSTAVTTTTVSGRVLTIGEVASGPKLLMIGDSILAGVSRRYSNLACDVLVPLGWQVSVEAERGRFIDLGVRVVDKKLPQGFDAAVVFLGTNYGRDQEVYRQYLDRVLDALEPRPVIIFTVTEYKPHLSEVNEVVLDEVDERDNLWLVDWRTISKDKSLLWRDGIHPVDAGNQVMMAEISRILGDAPGEVEGKCLPSEFRDDVPLNNPPPLTEGTTTTTDPTATTLPGPSTTGVAPASTSTTIPASSPQSTTTSSVPAQTSTTL